jgi:DNA-binding beta-propeller fold protein YncE
MLTLCHLLIVSSLSAPTPLGKWMDTQADVGGITAVAATPSGDIALLDGDTSAVLLPGETTPFDVSKWVTQPSGLAFGPTGRMYITCADRNHVIFFEPGGRMSGGCGGVGEEPFRLRSPSAVDVDAEHLVVADTGNNRIQVYQPDGLHLRSIRGGDDGPLRRPEGVAIDDAGRIWVADTHNHRVQCYTPSGDLVRSIGSWGTFPGQFMEPGGVEAGGGRVIVTDRLNHRVQVLDASTGAVIESWGMHAFRPRQGEGRVHYPEDAALAADGTVTIAEPFEERTQRFGPEGMDIPTAPPSPRDVQSHFGPTAATDGRFFCTWEPELRAVHIFDLDRTTPLRLCTFGTPGTAAGQLGHLTSLAVDADRNLLWAVDAGNGRLHEWALSPPPPDRPAFDPGMAVLSRSSPLHHAGDGVLHPTDQGLLHLDGVTGHARWLQADGQPPAAPPRAPRLPIAADGPAGRMAVLDAFGPRVQLTGDWPVDTVALPAVEDPVDLAVAADGSLLVLDRAGHRVHHFSPAGEPLGHWGGRGTGHGELWRPAAIEVDHHGRVIVLDHGNHRAQMFEPDGTWIMTFGAGRAWTRQHTTPARGGGETEDQ